MNKYVRAAVTMSCGAVKMIWTKLFHPIDFSASPICMVSPISEISIDKGAKLKIGKMLRLRDNAKIRVRKKASCEIGDKVAIGSGCIITCREKITIGSETQLGPNVMIYDHDHEFRKNNLSENKYRTAEIKIGKRVWIGANSVILKGVSIGDDAVIGAGTIVTKNIPEQTVFFEKKEYVSLSYEKKGEDM